EICVALDLPVKLTTLRAVAKHALETERRAFGDAPTGRLVKLAIFDHAFDGRPARPPLLTLEWADWREEPVTTFFPYAEKPAATLEEARVRVGGGDMLTADNTPPSVTAADLAKKREEEERAAKKREEEERAAKKREEE